MKLSSLTAFGFYINGALGSGKYSDISIQEVKSQLENHNLFNFLEEKLGIDVDTSHFSNDDKKELSEEWLDMSLAIDESRKLCVDKNGLALITAYILESLQRRFSKLSK
jgi:hypothetical protein